jgi:tRNA A37 threonylcarbamoyladenosine modification protein TsaB
MRIPSCVLSALLVTALPAGAQELFKCTDAAGKVTYQQTACPTTGTERKIDATPANPDYDPEARERLLRQGAEADQRIKERAAQDQAERLEREARDKEKRAEAERARKAQEAAEQPTYLVPPYMWNPVRPPLGYPQPRPPAVPRPPIATPRGP